MVCRPKYLYPVFLSTTRGLTVEEEKKETGHDFLGLSLGMSDNLCRLGLGGQLSLGPLGGGRSRSAAARAAAA